MSLRQSTYNSIQHQPCQQNKTAKFYYNNSFWYISDMLFHAVAYSTECNQNKSTNICYWVEAGCQVTMGLWNSVHCIVLWFNECAKNIWKITNSTAVSHLPTNIFICYLIHKIHTLLNASDLLQYILWNILLPKNWKKKNFDAIQNLSEQYSTAESGAFHVTLFIILC